MPSKKKKYNARFPAGRIKKIMQSDEEIGKVAQAVPVIISKTLELFVDSLLTKTLKITISRNAKTLSPSHMKQCIMAEQRFDFLRELVKNIPDISVAEEAANYNDDEAHSSPEEQYPDSDTPYDLSMPSTSTRASRPNGFGGGGGLHGHTQNGSSHNRILQRASSSIGHSYHQPNNKTNSVIMHTNSLFSNATNDMEPHLQPKLSRSESTPGKMTSAMPALHQQKPYDCISPQRRRLKQQSQSLPYNHNSHNNNNNTNNNNVAMLSSMMQPKQQTETAIPAPIVSFDFCNKPIVKIDYSNLQMSPVITPAAPLSAPALGIATTANRTIDKKSGKNPISAFDFNIGTPVINIDLSNIVATGTATTGNFNNKDTNKTIATTSSNSSTAAVATISIGPLSKTLPENSTEAIARKSASNLTLNLTKPLTVQPMESSPSTSYKGGHNTTGPSSTVAAKTSCFELDEDYDNI